MVFGKKKKKGEEGALKEMPELENDATASPKEGELEKKSLIKRLFTLKMMIFLFLILLIVGGGGFAGWYFFLKASPVEEGENSASMEQVEDGETVEDGQEAMLPPKPDFEDVVDLEPFEGIRIKESGNLFHLNLILSVELMKPEMRESFESATTLIRQTIEDDMKERTWITMRSPDGKLMMKYQLIEKLNRALPSVMVHNIYIRSMMFY